MTIDNDRHTYRFVLSRSMGRLLSCGASLEVIALAHINVWRDNTATQLIVIWHLSEEALVRLLWEHPKYLYDS